MKRTVCEVIGMDGNKPIFRTHTTDEIDESDDEQHPRRYPKRNSLKHMFMQLRCFLGDDTYPMTDAAVDALSKEAFAEVYREAGEKLEELWAPYRERQQPREHDGLAEGIEAYHAAKEKRLAKGWAAQDAVGRKLIARFIKPLRDWIIEFRMRVKAGDVMQFANAVRFIDCLRPNVAAYITIRTALAYCLQARHRGSGYVLWRDLTRELWTLLEAECRLFAVLKRKTIGAAALRKKIGEAEKALSHVTGKNKRRNLSQKIRRYEGSLASDFPKDEYAIPQAGQCGEDWKPPYTQRDKQQAAQILLARLEEISGGAFGYDTTFTESKGRKLRTPGVFFASRALWDEFQALHGRLESLAPIERPMIYPPLPWNSATGEIGGGYRFDLEGKANMVKTHNKEALRRIDRAKLTDGNIIDRTLEALQDTPFRINRRVYEVMQAVDDNRRWKRYKLPPRTPLVPDAAPGKWRAWKREGERKAAVLENILDEARDNLSERMIFFPYTYDFRGRIYASGGPLNPQGTKHALALLEFAEGRRMGEHPDSARWLKIHGANCYGEDKESIADRIAWTEKNTSAIVDVARDPFDSHNWKWWTKADEPWLFLAFCFEWADYQERGENHFTHLPIHVDGKCNGAQHMAALMRCKATGELVGLCEDDENTRPYDLYQAVAAMADARIKQDAIDGDEKSKPYAKRIIDAIALNPNGPFHINRKLVKGSVMTYGYGVTAHGMMRDIGEVIFEWLNAGDDEGTASDKDRITDAQWEILCPPEAVESDDGGEKEHTFGKIKAYIQRVVKEAIEEKAKAAYQVLGLLGNLAVTFTEILGEGEGTECSPIAWNSPLGFPVYFAKELWEYKPLETYLYPDAAMRRKDEAEVNDRKGRKPQGGRRITLAVKTGDKPLGLDAKAMKAGFPPCVIHSLDAAHMMKTVAYCLAKGVRSFATIHDSYATHATNMTVMNRELRRAFVDMYRDLDINKLVAGIVSETNSLIENIWPIGKTEKEIEDMLARGEMPEKKPARHFATSAVELTGTLDIDDVLKAPYFFA